MMVNDVCLAKGCKLITVWTVGDAYVAIQQSEQGTCIVLAILSCARVL